MINVKGKIGTRSLTAVMDGKDEIMVLYRQMDGYPERHGQDLKDFLAPFKICNGIGTEQATGAWANGMCCLAAQIVAHFKNSIGQFYLYPANTRGCGEEYIYTVTENTGHTLDLEVFGVYDEKMLYSGPVSEFEPKNI